MRETMEAAMQPKFRILTAAAACAAMLAPSLSLAQAPPKQDAPIAPKTEQLDPNACATHGAETTVGQGGDLQVKKPDGNNLSQKLAKSEGVICPPTHVDPEIKAPTPPGGAMPVIPPPGSPGGDPSVRPK
jgi:hypothetical protein